MTDSGSSRTGALLCLLALAVLAVGSIYYFSNQIKMPAENQKKVASPYNEIRVFFPAHNIAVIAEVADTIDKRTLGLSGRADLPEGRGMLFIFDTDSTDGFWMKDMNFNIDILWFDNNLRLVDMWQDARPDSYPKVVKPRTPARYVLEVTAGFAEKYSLARGDRMEVAKTN
ncbi:DUF192 domain-containing protein [bacterium]|nr:DUF192 domain-containing protein [bacterium]